MLKGFKDFLNRGSVVDLAVAVVIGAAFGSIVTSFVKDIVSPVIGLAGKANFDDMFLVLKDGPTPGSYNTPADAAKAGAITLNYGAFLTTVLNFLIIAFVIYLVVRAYERFKTKPAEAAPPAPSNEVVLLTEIRDLLKK